MVHLRGLHRCEGGNESTTRSCTKHNGSVVCTSSRSGGKRSTYTCRVDDPLAVAVECYAGAQGEETPRRFTFENQLVEIFTVVDQWRTPDHRYFKIKTAASESCTLRHDVKSGLWELTEWERSALR